MTHARSLCAGRRSGREMFMDDIGGGWPDSKRKKWELTLNPCHLCGAPALLAAFRTVQLSSRAREPVVHVWRIAPSAGALRRKRVMAGRAELAPDLVTAVCRVCLACSGHHVPTTLCW